MWDAAKAALRGKFIAINTYIKKLENLKQPNFTPQGTRKRRTNWPKVNRGKEITKIRAEINEIEARKTTGRINETKNWFFKKCKGRKF